MNARDAKTSYLVGAALALFLACSKDASTLRPLGVDAITIQDGGDLRDGGDSGVTDSGVTDGGRWQLSFIPGHSVAMNSRGTIAYTTTTPGGHDETWIRYADGGISYVGGRLTDGGYRDTIATGIADDDCVIGLSHELGDLPGGDPYIWCPGGSLQRLAADGGLTQEYRPVTVDITHRVAGDHQSGPFFWLQPDAGFPLPRFGRGNGQAVGFLGESVLGWVGRDSGYTAAVIWPTPTTMMLLSGGDGEDSAAYAGFADGRIFGGCPGPVGGMTACVWVTPTSPPYRLAASTLGASVAATRLAAGRIPYGAQSLPSGNYTATIWFDGPDGGPTLVESLFVDAGCWFDDVVGMNDALTQFTGSAVCGGVGTNYLAEFRQKGMP